jgi:hypothetical protein
MDSNALIAFIKFLDGDGDDKRLTAAQSLWSLDVDCWKIIRNEELLQACISYPQAINRIKRLWDVFSENVKIDAAPKLIKLCGGATGEQYPDAAEKFLSLKIPIGQNDAAVELLRAGVDHPCGLARIEAFIHKNKNKGKTGINVTPDLVALFGGHEKCDNPAEARLIGVDSRGIPADKITAGLVELRANDGKYFRATKELVGAGESVDADLAKAWADGQDGCQQLLDLRKAFPKFSIEITPQQANLCTDGGCLDIVKEFASTDAIVSADLVKCIQENPGYLEKAKEMATKATKRGYKVRRDEELIAAYTNDKVFAKVMND